MPSPANAPSSIREPESGPAVQETFECTAAVSNVNYIQSSSASATDQASGCSDVVPKTKESAEWPKGKRRRRQ